MTRAGTVFVATLVLQGVALPHLASADPTQRECVDSSEKAQSLRQSGKLRAAREQLAFCIAASCPGPVREDCAQRLAELASVQPQILFAAKDLVGNDLASVRVTMDGTLFAGSLDGTPLDVDPGEHVFRFESHGVTTEETLVVHEGERPRRETVRIDVGAYARDDGSVPIVPPRRGGVMGLVYASYGIGAVGLVVGSVFGGLALSTKSELDQQCQGAHTACPPDLVHSFNQQAWASNIVLTVGVAGAVLGTMLLVAHHPPSHKASAGVSVAPWIGPGAAGVSGSFE